MSDVVVVGLGYVGLPLVEEACRVGLRVTGLDINPGVVDALNAGKSHVDDLSDEAIAMMRTQGFIATSDASVVVDATTVVICVPTPLGDGGGPDLAAVRAASRAVGENLRPNTLVVLESTTYPGTTQEVVVPILEDASGLVAGVDFDIAYSPERIDPGNKRYGLRQTPKIVGADTDTGRARVRTFYSHLVNTVVEARGTREAESAKLLENTYRHVNIALVNEMAQFFYELGIDFWDVLDLAATKPFGFQSFRPGPGVGGHCIPIDPNYLSHQVRSRLGYPFRFVELAQEINAGMPAYVVRRASDMLNEEGRAVRGSTVLLLGVTYKPDIADQRESPAAEIAKRLLAMGAHVVYSDPHVSYWELDGVEPTGGDAVQAAKEAHLTILLQNHSAFDVPAIEQAASLLFDTRGVTTEPSTSRL